MDNRLRKIENALIGMGIKPNTNGFYWAVELTVGKKNCKRDAREPAPRTNIQYI